MCVICVASVVVCLSDCLFDYVYARVCVCVCVLCVCVGLRACMCVVLFGGSFGCVVV